MVRLSRARVAWGWNTSASKTTSCGPCPMQNSLRSAHRNCRSLNLLRPSDVQEGVVLRVPKAYPVYDATYQDSLREIRAWLDRFDNLQLIGRNGMHRYNNQDHSMLTGMLAARNVLGSHYDLWQVNADAEYHESGDVISEEELQSLEQYSACGT